MIIDFEVELEQTENPKFKMKMSLEGDFISEKGVDEKEFKQLVEVNGAAAIIGIARGRIEANLSNRVLKSSDAIKCNFDCNIQQIKTKEFDILFYGVFFADQIEIYKMTSNEVHECPGYSDKQHRGNKGEGQFHLNMKNIEYHRKKYLDQIITYEKLYRLLQ